MRTVVCISNNVVYDGRVKRTIQVSANVSERVDVVCLPIPDIEFGVKHERVFHHFVNMDFYDKSIMDKFQEKIDLLNVRKELISICPFFNFKNYNPDKIGKLYEMWLRIKLKGNRWEEIRKHVSQEMTYTDAMSYILTYFYRAIGMVEEVIKYPADVVYCNDLDTLLCGIIHKRKYGSRLIYDVHDLLYDLSPNVFPFIYCGMLALLEHKYINEVDELISVSEAYLIWLKQFHCIDVSSHAILNCVESYRKENIKKKEYESSGAITVYFHGNASEVRNLHLIIEAMNNVDEINLMIRSNTNSYVEELKKQVEFLELEKRVTFCDYVPYDRAVYAAHKDGDVGIYASSPENCLNWKFAMTIKFFEYLAAGLPVITTDTLSQSSIIKKYNCGFILENTTVTAIEDVFRNMISRRDELQEMSENALRATKEELNWDLYEGILKNLVLNKEKCCNHKRAYIANKKKYEIQDEINNMISWCIGVIFIVKSKKDSILG